MEAAAAVASEGPYRSVCNSAGATAPSWLKIARAEAEIKRALSLENNDRDTSASSKRVKLSVRFFTRIVTSLECAAVWKEDV